MFDIELWLEDVEMTMAVREDEGISGFGEQLHFSEPGITWILAYFEGVYTTCTCSLVSAVGGWKVSMRLVVGVNAKWGGIFVMQFWGWFR